MKVRSLSTSLTLLSLAISTQLYAQNVEQTSTVNQLAPIVMTATRSAQSIAEIAGTVYRISQEDIAKQAAAGKSTADILGLLVPSLTPSSGTTSNYGMTMRGRTVQYMIDGVSSYPRSSKHYYKLGGNGTAPINSVGGFGYDAIVRKMISNGEVTLHRSSGFENCRGMTIRISYIKVTDKGRKVYEKMKK